MTGVEQNTPHHKYDVAEHTIRAMKYVKRDINIAAYHVIS